MFSFPLLELTAAAQPPQYTLSVSTAGGGTITVNPPGSTVSSSNFVYASNTLVSATANPAAGFTFLYWQGGATDNNRTTSFAVDHSGSLSAVFGTTISNTITGNGQVLKYQPGGLYQYGSVVRLTALPQAGYEFGAWGNAASGTANPLYFTVTNPTPTISSVFTSLPSNQAALTVQILGLGQVGANPAANAYGTNQSVMLTATPSAGQSFLYWSGDASGTQNPLTVAMTQNRVIQAHFTGQFLAIAGQEEPPTPFGYFLLLFGDAPSVYQIFSSTNLTSWQSAGSVTNNTGLAFFNDTTAINSRAKYYRARLTQ